MSGLADAHSMSQRASMKTRATYEANLKQLVGFAIECVVYFELDYQDGRQYFRDYPETGHFLDFGVELIDATGRTVCLTWDGTFFQYGMGVYVDIPSAEVLPGLAYDVTNDPEWTPFLRRKIVAVESYWTGVFDSMAPDATETSYPQDIRITFDNNRSLYLSAAQFLNDSGELSGMSDNVLIIFHDEVAQKHKLGPWAVG